MAEYLSLTLCVVEEGNDATQRNYGGQSKNRLVQNSTLSVDCLANIAKWGKPKRFDYCRKRYAQMEERGVPKHYLWAKPGRIVICLPFLKCCQITTYDRSMLSICSIVSDRMGGEKGFPVAFKLEMSAGSTLDGHRMQEFI